MRSIFQAQAAALLAGDEHGWLRDVDPGRPDVVNTYKLIFANLRAMRIARWEIDELLPQMNIGSQEQVDAVIDYCFIVPSCDAGNVPPTTTLRIAFDDPSGTGKMAIVDVQPSRSSFASGPLPWQQFQLRAAVGTRVVVAAPAEVADWIPKALPLAESAAAVADRYARWQVHRGPYVIYLGQTSDFTKWYRLPNTGDELGLAVQVSADDIQVLINVPDAADPAKGDGLQAVIQHELGHVVTLLGEQTLGDDSFIEGIAEYIAHAGQPVSTIWNGSVAWYLRSGQWNGSVYLDREISSHDPNVRAAAYGIGYLTMRHLADRYGEDRALAFYADVKRDGDGLDASARLAFGVSWQAVNQDCARYIRSVVARST